MKKAMLGFIAAAMSLMATTAQAAVGDIRSIDPCDLMGTAITPGTTNVAGETAYFRIRLENVNSSESFETRNSADRLANYWRFEYLGEQKDWNDYEWYVNGPKVGVLIGGEKREASIVYIGEPKDINFPDNHKGLFTDIVCAYKVLPGDLALPMTLQTVSGVVGTESAVYRIYNLNDRSFPDWQLVAHERDPLDWSTVIGVKKCSFKFGSESSWLANSFGFVQEAEAAGQWPWTPDITLEKAKLYINTLQPRDYNEVIAQFSGSVTVDILGGTNTSDNGAVWVKIKDGSNVALAANGVTTEKMWDGTASNEYQVAKIVIPVGADKIDIPVYGLNEDAASDQGTVLYLSSTKYFTSDEAGDISADYIEVLVNCKKAEPNIQLYFDYNSAQGAVNIVTNTVVSDSNWTVKKTTLELVRWPATSPVTVRLSASNINDSASPSPIGNLVGLSFTETVTGYTKADTEIKFEANESRKSVHVYVRGATPKSQQEGIEFKAAVESGAAADYYKTESAILFIKESKPVILDPVQDEEFDGVPGGVEYLINIQVQDDYNNMKTGGVYSVEFYKTDKGAASVVTPVSMVPDSEGYISFKVKYAPGEYKSSFIVKNPSGVKSDKRNIRVKVNPVKQVYAVIEDDENGGEFDESTEDGYEQELKVRFYLTEEYEDDLWAFLKPVYDDVVSTNLIETTAFKKGVKISGTNSVGAATIRLLDGTADTQPLTYEIVLRTARDIDDGALLEGIYASRDLEIFVNNVPPKINYVTMGADELYENGGRFLSTASVGSKKTFAVDVEDVPADYDATNKVKWVWRFVDENGRFPRSYEGESPLNEIATNITFGTKGIYSGSIKIQDKDMGNRFGEEFRFTVEVRDQPAVEIDFPNSNTFNETDADKGLASFFVKLTDPADADLDVKIEVERVGLDGVLDILTTTVHFPAGIMEKQVLIDTLDGTPNSASFKGGFTVKAYVTTETKSENGQGEPWKEVYNAASVKMFVANEPPTIILPQNTGITNDAPINVNIPIKWKIEDVDADTNSLSVVWTTNEGGDPAEFNTPEGVFTNMFKTGGSKIVTMTVTDKDGAYSIVQLFYNVSPSKRVTVYPYGPSSSGGLSPVAKQYIAANGRGAGRIWADGTSKVSDFIHSYTYGDADTIAQLYAWGYKSGQVDDGELKDASGKDGRDIPINKVGDLAKKGQPSESYFAYDSALDSFFYAWVLSSQEEGATTYNGVSLISPENPSTPGAFANYALPLPIELVDDRPIYPDSFVEVFFSKELYASDNMGDMNADGIPDYYATLGWSMDSGESKSIAEAMTGVKISNGSSEGGEGVATASDLTDVSSYNGDLDFFPAAWNSPNPLKPTNKNWGPGLPFTAYDEIRGIGVGLNHPGVSEYNLTAAEKFALLADYAAATDISLAGTVEENMSAATNWAAQVRWTPEVIHPTTGARLNPLKADTDGDGFDDGWEYFFWYHAKVGAVADGKWERLEGRRFIAPGKIERISHEEIMAAFDPIQKRSVTQLWGSDFDNDGLTDFEEYILGTNPTSCDIDGDGVLELYKVMNGIDPVFEFDNGGNPDCDFMARCDYAGDTFTVYSFANGEMYALPTKTASAPVLEVLGAEEDVYKVVFASGDVGWFKQLPVTIPGLDSGTMLFASNFVGYTALTVDGTECLGMEKEFATGSVVTEVASNPVKLSQMCVANLTWTDPVTLLADSTDKALPLFNYRGDGVTYVPCAPNVLIYALLPTDSALVKVESKKTITLIHNQVYGQYGFDPRVAWNVDDFGYVDQRWRQEDSSASGGLQATGYATNTVPYTTVDEFFVMQYRQQMRFVDDKGKRIAGKSFLNDGDVYLADLDSVVYDVSYLKKATTYPNLPVSFVREKYASREEVSPFENSTNRTIVSYWTYLEDEHDVHGADTDFDGVPDGWELYVNADPNKTEDAKIRDGWANDDDGLCILEEYAGVDSCNAYTNRFSPTDPSRMIYPEAETITKNHPGKDKGWWNKFFPSNPQNKDTDGDGVLDDAEGKGWNGEFNVGNSWYGSQPMTFIYGDNADKYAGDASSTCFRGGGLNPCTVDTDGDLLPDAWEYQFAGIIFKGGKTNVPVSQEDLAVLIAADGKQSACTNTDESVVCIRGGMDGTFKDDACFDFDHDGLVNCQEYLVQSLRHLRYDDSLTPLMGLDPTTKKFVRFIPFSSWDGEAFHKHCLKAGFTGLGSWMFRELGYFALPPYEWDMLRQNKQGVSRCANYKDSEGAGYRIMLPPVAFLADGSVYSLYVNGAMQYASTDPRRVDTDYDGMDDYWELFHGLNPLLGSYADPTASGEYGWPNSQFDKIAEIHGSTVDSWYNHWTDWGSTQPALDPVKHPWMMGVMEADADGDGLRNDEEALKVNLAKPLNTHTDPTPLWMTDSSGKASYTSQYYNPDPYISDYTGGLLEVYPDLLMYPWADLTANIRLAAEGMGGISLNWMFAFEENEGYDTDHDFRRDSTELTANIEVTSDPLKHSDLYRRQALYFPGFDGTIGSAAVSYGGEFRRSPSTEPDLLKQFTVECWVKPETEQADATILERVCDYGASTLSQGAVIRANFRIGINEGRVYGEFQGSTANSVSIRVEDSNKLPVGKWTHVAFRFDGTDAHLHINGSIAPVASVTGGGVIPANGIDGIQQTPGQSVIPLTGYRALPCATVLGASMTASSAFKLDDKTEWSDFGKFYKGWVDEVRIWDGARTAAEINGSYKVAFSMDNIKEMRSNQSETGIFDLWRSGSRRSNVNGDILPAELLQHYSFSTLPGGVEAGNVITEPTGFRESVLNNVRKPDGGSLDLHTMVGWWYNTPVHSVVYWDYHVVPWIPNTVAHLPFLDGSAPDSQFWSAGVAGVDLAASMGIKAYEFPNSANPYPYYFYRRDRYNRLNLLAAVEGVTDSNTVTSVESLMYEKWRFDLRSGFVGTSDLVPLGYAFAKRDVEYWDGQGSMDAWTDTKASSLSAADKDGDGIPDWAEKLGLDDREKYLRALAAGLLPNGQYDPNFKADVDSNFDGLKDWWQKMYGLADSAQDADKDGLADFAEYLVSEVFFTDLQINPQLPKSDSNEFDYFRKPEGSRLYLGEMFSDHDFMEDHLESEYSEIGASPAYYDAHLDSDDDGWSNWAEVRAKNFIGIGWNATGIVQTNTIFNTYSDYADYTDVMKKIEDDPARFKLLDTTFTITGYSSYSDSYYGTGYIKYQMYTTVYSETYLYEGTPVPEVEMTVRYNGLKELDDTTVLSVEAYPDGKLDRSDALFNVQYGQNRNVNTVKFKYPVKGYLREGMNTFVVSLAQTNENGSASSLMGVVRGVDVGWNGAKFEVELTESTPICRRSPVPTASTNETAAVETDNTVYVYRYAVDGISPMRSMNYGPILVKGLGSRLYMHEGDLLSETGYDLDWDEFQSEILDNNTVSFNRMAVTNVVYRVYPCKVDIDAESVSSNAVPYVEIVREFGSTRAKAIPVSPGEDHSIYYGAQPTFRWSVEGDRTDTYTAFAIQVKDDSGVIWNSGTQMLPPKNSSGEYVWTAPLYVGDQTALGKIFASQGTYTWSATMYNSKYQNDDWSEERAFRVNVYDNDEPNNTGFYTLDAVVKYFGPGVFDADVGSTNRKIRVEAFTSPDFTGTPAGRAFVSDVDSVVDSNHEVNVKILGLPAGEYYVRAYLDSDGDFKRSAWESWGYACPRGDKDTGTIYAPTSVSIGNSMNPNVAVVYLEDTDMDQDVLPDVWEYDEAGGAEDFLLKQGPMVNKEDGYIAVNPGLVSDITRVVAANAGGGIMTLAASGYMPTAMAAMMLGVDSVEPEIEDGTLGITAFSLNGDTVTLTVGAKADDPLAGSAFVNNGTVTAKLDVLHASSLESGFKPINSEPIEVVFEFADGEVTHTETISLKEVLGDDLPSSGFFKVELR